jgi:GT2 family glycosyltransferase
MTPRAAFDEVGGLSMTLPVNFNDVDYCLKLHAGGRRIVYDPDLVMYHFESSSRDPEVEKWEVEQLEDRWAGYGSPDPYGNPNLRYGLPRIPSYLAWAKRRTKPMLKRQRRRLEATR